MFTKKTFDNPEKSSRLTSYNLAVPMTIDFSRRYSGLLLEKHGTPIG